ncbi:hypothetical protein [Georgenia muralis]|uniref:RAMA domain-containing protein n=1 Tax=Georgenia muralis TaxID=154117 RepID=A0A3N4Z4G9_9MICO|nr:hypothetical protein [Georgenia muralis]RPF27367.1 hypothetical protein EDD32_1847 [Georgenia muralis]
MPFFEFDEGRLVPAQFGHAVTEDIDPEVLQAVRDQVLEVVQRPLFPVSWYGDVRRAGTYGATAASPRLTAMDASGQVVTVEVVDRLDSAALVAALSRSGRNADLGWAELSGLYPRGADAFRREWNLFRESMPPRTTPGPRLVVVAGTVEEEVRPALEVLGDSGVVVHEIAVRRMSNGRQFLEINELRPDLLEAGGALLTSRERSVEITATARPREYSPDEPGSVSDEPGSTADEPDGARDERARVTDGPAGGQPDETSGALPRNRGSEESTPPMGLPVHGAHSDDGATAAGSDGPGDEDREGLVVVAASLGSDTGLVWHQLRRGVRHEAILTADGMIRLPDGATFLDPDAAATAASGRDDVDGWRVWRFGEAGPTLADARSELAAAVGRVNGGRRRG